ncbi:hypothetical protein QE152_g27375 [Popillia japonica]|uniref:Uncharacterized protein n=1 Tax=Popillia japonica TaxID=7064 RepID=A0AAW1JSK9_POPJA
MLLWIISTEILKNNHSNPKYKNYAAVDNIDGNITFSNPKYKNYAAVDNIDGNITFSNSSSLKTNVVCDTFPKTDLPLLRHINGATNWAGRGSHKRPFKDPQMARVIKEAIMTAYGKAESKPIDLGDVNIDNAIKD